MVERGTIFRNMHQPLHHEYLVFVMAKGTHAHCIRITFPTDGDTIVSWNVGIWFPSLESDRLHFPIVGNIKLDDLVVSRVLTEINKSNHAIEEES